MGTSVTNHPVSRTRNDLPEETRAKMIELLNQRLADCIDLQTQSKQAHWNVKGPSFFGLHTLFDQINEAVEEYVDEIAERSTLPEYPHEIKDGMDHVRAMSVALSSFGSGAREAINQADEAEDKDTADLFTEISRGIDKWLWFVEAHAQGSQGPEAQLAKP